MSDFLRHVKQIKEIYDKLTHDKTEKNHFT